MTTYQVLTAFTDEQIDPALPDYDANDPANPMTGLNNWIQAALLAEPDDTAIQSGTPAGPVTRWFSYHKGRPFRQDAFLRSEAQAITIQPGDPNPFFMIFDSLAKDGKIQYGNGPFDLATAYDVKRPIWRTPAYAIALVMTGGEAFDLPVFFEVVPTDLCPFSPTDAVDEEGTPIPQERWQTWGTTPLINSDTLNHAPMQIGDKWYRSSIYKGQRMKATEWASLYFADPTKVLSEEQFKALVAANAPVEA